MKGLDGYSSIEVQMNRWIKELELEKRDKVVLHEYEEKYTHACEGLKSLASTTMAHWEPARAELHRNVEQHISDGLSSEAIALLEEFLLRSKTALTEYRRQKSQTTLPYRKAPVNIKEYAKSGSVRKRMEEQVSTLQARISELVTDAKQEAATALQYLQDIHGEAEKMFEALQRKVERTTSPLPSSEPQELLQAVHQRLTQAGKVRMSYHDFALQLREGTGSFHFVGKQTDLAYLLLFLNKNGLADNWRSLNLSYVKNGVATKTTAQSIRETHKKLSSRNEPEIKNLLAGLKESFPELVVP